MKWIRARDGALFGVCKGIARALEMPVGIVRLTWIACILLGGVGLGVYLLLAISLPREDKAYSALEPRLLGVCVKLAKKTSLEVGIVRFIALCLLFASLGLTSVLYLIGYFAMDDQDNVASRNKPSSPLSTM